MKKDTPIQILQLSKRSYNVLEKFNIITVQDLLTVSVEDIKNFKGIGKKSIQEILSKIELLKDHNFDNIDISEIEMKISKDKYFTNKFGEKYKDIPIEDLGLSEESKNFLKELGIEYYSELLTKSDEEFELPEYLENTVQKEIRSLRRDLNIEVPINIRGDISIDYLRLSARAKNCLKIANIKYCSQLFYKTKEELKAIKQMGGKTLKELQRFKFLIFFYFGIPANIEDKGSEKEKISKESVDFLKKVAKILNCNTEKLISNISDHYFSLVQYTDLTEKNDYNYITENIVSLLWWRNSYGKEKWLKYIIRQISKNIYGIEEDVLWESIPEILKDKKIYKKTIEYLCESNLIKKLYDDRFVIVYKSVKEEVYNYLTENEANIFLNRISGKTLEEIGDTLEITRERVRQIEAKGLKKLFFGKFKEDFFKDIYLKYDVNKEAFLVALREEETYNYLSLRYRNELNQVKNARKSLQELLEDEEIPAIIRRAFEKFVYKDYITFDKERILVGRASFTNYIIKHFANDGMSYIEFKEMYDMFLTELGYEKEESLKIVDRSYENRIRDDMNVLWKPKKKFRYYNISGYDFSDFLETLNLSQYKNEEYSSLKFFKMYPDLMKMYDIRDEYELHNLLKKICTVDKYPEIKFSRMPSIEFGKADREQQVKELLSLLSPISKQDFINEYEYFYGVDSKTFAANYLSYIDEYNCSGIYDTTFEEYDDSIFLELKDILSEELYTVQEVKEKIEKTFPNYKKEFLNPILLKKLGYKISRGYIVKSQYDSASSYFCQFLQKNEIVKLDDISSKIKSLPMFTSQIYKLKYVYEIIEFSPNKFVNFIKLKKLGITKEDLKQYCSDVLEFIGKDKYFTTFSLKKNGFYHELDELGFDDYFYTSILIEDKNRISYRRIGKNKLMYSNGEGANFEDFLERIVYKQEKLYIEVYDLNDLLRDEYNIVLDVHDVISSVKSTSMFYDPISKIVFADYEIYYEVI